MCTQMPRFLGAHPRLIVFGNLPTRLQMRSDQAQPVVRIDFHGDIQNTSIHLQKLAIKLQVDLIPRVPRDDRKLAQQGK